MTEQTHHTATEQPQQESGLAITSLVLGVISITGPGLLLGIPAIVTGSIALKRNLGGRNLALAGLITGIISTILSILLIMFVALLIIVSAGSNDNSSPQYDTPMQHYYQMQS